MKDKLDLSVIKEAPYPTETNVLYLVVGKSGSGKNTLVDNFRHYYPEWKEVLSYTTRPQRNKDDKGHIFVSKKEFDEIAEKEGGMVGYTFFNGNHYGVTSSQLDKCNFYIIDKYGVDTLLEKYKTNRPIHIIYINSSWYVRLYRMLKRGDGLRKAIKRLQHDKKAFEGVYYVQSIDGNRDIKNATLEFAGAIMSRELVESHTNVDDLINKECSNG